MTLWTHRKGTVSLATRRKLWEHLLCSVLLCPSPAQPATCHLRISSSLTFYEVQTGQFLPVEEAVMLKKLGEGCWGGNPCSQWGGHVACTPWGVEEEFSSAELSSGGVLWFISLILSFSNTRSLPHRALALPQVFNLLCSPAFAKQFRDSAAVSSLFIQLLPEGTGNNTYIFLCFQRSSQMLIHARDL